MINLSSNTNKHSMSISSQSQYTDSISSQSQYTDSNKGLGMWLSAHKLFSASQRTAEPPAKKSPPVHSNSIAEPDKAGNRTEADTELCITAPVLIKLLWQPSWRPMLQPCHTLPHSINARITLCQITVTPKPATHAATLPYIAPLHQCTHHTLQPLAMELLINSVILTYCQMERNSGSHCMLLGTLIFIPSYS